MKISPRGFDASRARKLATSVEPTKRKDTMAKGYFVVRAEVADPAVRERFDHKYATDHLP